MATILSRQVSFFIDDSNAINTPLALLPKDVLPLSWLPAKTKALLDRAMFDSASYGCLRFHHRRHAEYLAAMWLERLMAGNCPLDVIDEVLFATVDGQRILRPSLEPVAAWLVKEGSEPWRQRLAQRLLESAPDVHLRWGDPAALPLDYRRKLLANIVRRFSGRKQVRLAWNRDALARIATPELSEDICGYLRHCEVAEDLKADFLMLVCYGKLDACVPVVLEILVDEAATDNLKIYAATVVRDIGSLEHRQQAAVIFEQMKAPRNDLIGLMCEVLFPQVLSVATFLALIPKCGAVRRNSLDLPYALRPVLEQGLTASTAGEMLRGVLGYLKEPPLVEGKLISQRYVWLLSLLPACLRKLMSGERLDDEGIGLAIEAILLLESGGRNGLWESSNRNTEEKLIEKECVRHDALRRAMFWTRVAKYRTKYQREPFLHGMAYGAILPLSNVDLDWLLAEVASDQPIADRKLALQIASDLMQSEAGRSHSDFWHLLRSVTENRQLLVFAGKLVWGRVLFPFRRAWRRQRYQGVGDSWWWRRKKQSLEAWYRGRLDRWWLSRHLGDLRKGAYPQSLVYFARLAGCDSHDRYSAEGWSLVKAEWGGRIADAARSGCEAAWRNFVPPLPHQKAERNSVDLRVVIGLAGLQTLWQRGALDFAVLFAGDVYAATRYACNELNGFPGWFDQLLAARSKEVGIVLGEAIAGEWLYSADMQHVSDVVAKMAWRDADMRLVVPFVLDQLQAGDPVHPKMLDYVFSILLKNRDICVAELTALASVRTIAYVVGSQQWFSWVVLWLQLDAMPALDSLETTLSILLPEAADELVVNLCGRLSGRRSDEYSLAKPSYLAPHCLVRLIPLVAGHVRSSEDINRAGGGVYGPTSRDDAQQFRSRLWELLGSSKEKGADEALRSLLGMPELVEDRDWILHLLDGRRETRADGEPWLATDVRGFSEHHLVAPRSDYTLFRLVCRHLDDIRNEIECSENAANRKRLRDGDLESQLRGILFEELGVRGQDWFSVTQESEVDLEERPDLTVKRPGLNSLPIEIKLANLSHWTLPKLMKGLETQLVGQYLRPAHIGYGIYVLGNTDPARRWEDPDGGGRIGFDALVTKISNRAAALQAELRDGVEALFVIGIDFSDPRLRKKTAMGDAVAVL